MLYYQQPNIAPISTSMYILVNTWTYSWSSKDVYSSITIPEGFVYDGASIPKIFWSIIGLAPDGIHRAAAIVHDWIYTFKGNLPPGSVKRKIILNDGDVKYLNTIDVWTQKDCDKFFKKMLLQTPLPRWKVKLMFTAVRMFGWTKWYI